MLKFEWKTQRKISLNSTWLLLGKTFLLEDAFSRILELEASPVDGQQQQEKDKKRGERKGEKIN